MSTTRNRDIVMSVRPRLRIQYFGSFDSLFKMQLYNTMGECLANSSGINVFVPNGAHTHTHIHTYVKNNRKIIWNNKL